MMTPTIVIDIVGLTPRHLGPLTPRLAAFARDGEMQPLTTITPAVTCSVQATFLTGTLPSAHGIVANGWLFRDLMEVWLWRQSNQLIAGERIWDTARRIDPRFTCANMFWWYNMAAGHDIGVTPRPIYKADGRKLPDCYTKPAGLRDVLPARLGPFPLFHFWGPATTIASSRWIAEATKIVLAESDPTLTLVYLPHLDYDLQRHGPDENHPAVQRSLAEIDEVAGGLIDFARARGRRVVVLSEYGITAVDRPVHINRALRAAGFLAVREEDGGELLDPIASAAFAVADHQIAHVYVKNPADVTAVRDLIAGLPGVERAAVGGDRTALGLDHARSGEIVALSDARSWFTYYYWESDDRAPDFARTVEIHRKPGYDPAELLVDPAIRWPKLKIAGKLLGRQLGLRTLMDLIPLDATLVRGSHGRPTDRREDGPLIMTDQRGLLPHLGVSATGIKDLVLQALRGH